MTNPRRVHSIVLGLYTLLSLLLTWPLLTHITTQVPGVAQWAFDESTFLWNLWYFKDAVVDRLSNPLHTELIYYPLGIDLVLYTYNFFHALLAQPLMLAVNLPLGSNVALLASTVLSGYGTFLLVWYLLGRNERLRAWANESFSVTPISYLLPSFIAGLLYAFASNRSIYAALGHYDMVTTQWIPFYALMLLRSLDQGLSAPRRRQAAALGGLFFALTGLAEMISALFLAIFTVIVLVCYRPGLFRERGFNQTPTNPISNLKSLISALLILGVVAFLLWSPVLIPILRQFLTDDFSLKGWGEAIALSTDLLGWFTPTVLHPLWGGDLVGELRRVQLRALDTDGTGFRDLNTVFLGWVSLGLALLAAFIYRRRVAVWIWTSLLFGIFTLGPFLQINGRYRFDLDGVEATFPLPYALLHYLPIIKANRAPNRNSVLLMLGLAVLVGYACYWVVGIGYSRWAAKSHDKSPIPAPCSLLLAFLAFLILFEHLALPFPLSDARIPAVYEQIAADPRPISVLQAPLGWRNSFGTFGPEKTLLQYYQSAHGKPMLGGNISRAPDFKLDYFKRIEYFHVLTEVEFGRMVEPDRLAAAQAQAAELVYLYNVGYVLLHPPIPERYPYADHWEATWDFLKTTLPLEAEPFWAGNGIEAYRTVQPRGEDRFELDLGPPGTYPYRGEGWDAAETDAPYDTSAIWATAQESHLFLPLRQVDPAATYQLSLRVRPFAWPGAPPQTIGGKVNDLTLEQKTLTDGWQEVIWQTPGSALIDSLNRVTFTWGQTASPRQVIPGDRQIGSTGVALPIDADLKGFAEGGFIALFDENGRQIDASAGRRGVNVTVLDRQSGEITAKVGFDTTANAFESEALIEFLHGVQTGAPVLIVSHGAATTFLTERAVEALRALGAEVTLKGMEGQFFAIAGVQGAASGTAAVALDSQDAFLRISLNRDQRTLAAAVDWVKLMRSAE